MKLRIVNYDWIPNTTKRKTLMGVFLISTALVSSVAAVNTATYLKKSDTLYNRVFGDPDKPAKISTARASRNLVFVEYTQTVSRCVPPLCNLATDPKVKAYAQKAAEAERTVMNTENPTPIKVFTAILFVISAPLISIATLLSSFLFFVTHKIEFIRDGLASPESQTGELR